MSLPKHSYYSSAHLKLFAYETGNKRLIKLLEDYEDYVDENYRRTRRRSFGIWRKKNKKHMNDLLRKWRAKKKLEEKSK